MPSRRFNWTQHKLEEMEIIFVVWRTMNQDSEKSRFFQCPDWGGWCEGWHLQGGQYASWVFDFFRISYMPVLGEFANIAMCACICIYIRDSGWLVCSCLRPNSEARSISGQGHRAGGGWVCQAPVWEAVSPLDERECCPPTQSSTISPTTPGQWWPLNTTLPYTHLGNGSKKNVKVWSLTIPGRPPPPKLRCGLLIAIFFQSFFKVTKALNTFQNGFYWKLDIWNIP